MWKQSTSIRKMIEPKKMSTKDFTIQFLIKSLLFSWCSILDFHQNLVN